MLVSSVVYEEQADVIAPALYCMYREIQGHIEFVKVAHMAPAILAGDSSSSFFHLNSLTGVL